MISESLEKRLGRTGSSVLRWSLVFIFVSFGLHKLTTHAAAHLALMAHSPFLFWVVPLLGERGGSALIGVVEISLGVLIALRHVRPILSAYGSLAASAVLLVTLSFLFTTPGLDPQSNDVGFLIKDLTLFGAALWAAAEAFAAARSSGSADELAERPFLRQSSCGTSSDERYTGDAACE